MWRTHSLATVLKHTALAVALASVSAVAPASIIFSGASGTQSASVTFDLVGGVLEMVLTNTGSADVLVPTDVLTAVFFDLASGADPTLTRVGATTLGTTTLGGVVVSNAGAVVGGEWAYLTGLIQYGANSGISSAGLGIFGPGDLFPGANLSGPAAPNGLQYGIASAGDNPGTGNAAVTGNELTENAVTYLLGGVPGGFDLSDITNVTFQYGASLTDPSFAATAISNAECTRTRHRCAARIESCGTGFLPTQGLDDFVAANGIGTCANGGEDEGSSLHTAMARGQSCCKNQLVPCCGGTVQ